MRKLVLLAAMVAATSAQAAPREAFWFDSNNVVVKDGQGNCLRTSFWTDKDGVCPVRRRRQSRLQSAQHLGCSGHLAALQQDDRLRQGQARRPWGRVRTVVDVIFDQRRGRRHFSTHRTDVGTLDVPAL